MRIGLLSSVGMTHDAFFPEIAAELRRRSHYVVHAAGTSGQHVEVSTISGLTRRPGVGTLRAAGALRKWVDENELSVVVSSTATASILARQAIVNCPVIYFCHGLHWQSSNRPAALPWVLAERYVLKKTAGILVLNREDEEWFRAHAVHTPMVRLRFGVGVDPTSYPRSPLPGGKLKLCWIGEFSQRKNPLDAVDVASRLRDRGVEFSLAMLGDGALQAATKRKVHDLELDEKVELPGTIPAAPVLTRSHALVHTARWEGLPRVFLEALAVGRPIFSYDIKGARDLPNVTLSAPGSPALMADKIINPAHLERTPAAYPTLDDLSFVEAAAQIELMAARASSQPVDERGDRRSIGMRGYRD
ncbi:MAG: glycosyltransferase [Jatrophihabitans sp.]